MSEKIVQLNEEVIKGQLRELVRGSVEEALIEMYLAGVSVRRVEDITVISPMSTGPGSAPIM